MALPLLLPLLGAVGAGVTGAVRGQRQQQGREQAASDIMTLMGQTGPRAGMEPTQQQAAFSALSGQDPLARQVAMQAMTPPDIMSQLKQQKLMLENQKTALDIEQMQNPQAVQDPNFVAKTADNLFGQRRTDLLPYASNLQNFRDLTSVLSQESGPAAMAATFKFIQGLDDSVVRESESRMLMGGSGIANQLVSAYNRAIGQGFLTDDIAQEIFEAAQAVAQQQQAAAQQINRAWDAKITTWAEQMVIPNLQQLVGPSIQFRDRPLPQLQRQTSGQTGNLPTGQTETINGEEFEVLN